MAASPILALLAGLGGGVKAVDDIHRLDDEQRQRQASQRAMLSLQDIEQRARLRDLGLRPQTEDDVSAAAGRELAALPGPTVTPAAISVPAPQIAKLPGQSPLRTFAQSNGTDAAPAAGDPARAIKQLVVQQTFGKTPGDVRDGPTLSAALKPETIRDVYGQSRAYVTDPSITPEARDMRARAAEAQTAEAARIRAEQAKSAETKKQFVDRQRADYNTLRAEFPERALSKLPFDENDPADYNAALAAARAERHDTSVAAAARDRQTLSPVKISNIMQLQAHFNSDKAFVNSTQVAEGYQKVVASAQNPSAAGDLSLLYGYNKMLDPGSAVREGEFATVAKSGSLPEQIRAAALRVANGQRLTPEQRQDFVDRAKAIALAQRKQLQSAITRYEKVARRHDIDPADIVADPFEVIFDVAPTDTPTDAPRAGTFADPDYLDAWLKANPAGRP